MDKLVKLKTDCMKQLIANRDYERRFRIGVGFKGFIESSRDPNRSIDEIFKEMKYQSYYKKNNVDILLYIFHVMEILECEELVKNYIAENITNTAPVGATPRAAAPSSLTDGITDPQLFEIANKIPIGNLDQLAVVGLGMTNTQVENLTDDCNNNREKIMAVLKEWKQSAPIGGGPFCTFGGLRYALKRADLNGVISDLGLNKYR